jgi:exosortase E/protease (VPEID-CTERM system)
LGTNSFQVEISPGCSGYEGIGLIVVVLSVFLWWYRSELRFPRAILLLPIGVAVIWFVNAARIAALIVIGTSLSPSIAAGGFHSQAGWIAFNIISLGLIAIVWSSDFFLKSTASNPASIGRADYPAAPYLVPFLVLVATVMITNAVSAGGFDRLYFVRVLTTAGALAFFANRYRDLGLLGLSSSWPWAPVIIGVAVFALWMFLEPLSGVSDADRLAQSAGINGMAPMLAAIWILFRMLGSVIIAPVVEELAFRGYLTRRLIVEEFDSLPLGTFSWFACLASSLSFGLMHGRWIAGSLAGILFAVALYRRGRLMDAVVAHATANGLVTLYVLATGNWAAWS